MTPPQPCVAEGDITHHMLKPVGRYDGLVGDVEWLYVNGSTYLVLSDVNGDIIFMGIDSYATDD